MAKPYFRNVPNFDYVSRTKNAQSISDYITVKNLFKRGKIRDDIFGDLTFFTKYKIIGDQRPDNVAYEIYGDETLDWVVLLSNNILNIEIEWPLSQTTFDKIMLEKYGSYDNFYSGIHHYETKQVTNSSGAVIIPEGLKVQENYPSLTYYDSGLENEVTVSSSNFVFPINNYEYEMKVEDDKRNIFLLKPIYLNVLYNDLETFMPYKKGSQQYVSETLKRADNIRLY
jgi:hypothetical protein